MMEIKSLYNAFKRAVGGVNTAGGKRKGHSGAAGLKGNRVGVVGELHRYVC